MNAKLLDQDNKQFSLEEFIPLPYDHNDNTSNLPTWYIRFELLDCENPVDICFEINGDVILGVENGAKDVINLSNYNTKVVGVSRKHLKISPSQTDLVLIDLESTNGTRRNGRRIQPNVPYNLYNGDLLELGNLTFTVNIVKGPRDQGGFSNNNRQLLETLTHISTLITSGLEIDIVLDRILELSIKLCNADEIALLIFNESANEFFLRAERGVGDKKSRLMKVAIEKDNSVSEVFQTGRSLRKNMVNGQKEKVVTGFLVDAALYVPIALGDNVIGILIATHSRKGKEFSHEDENLLSTIGKLSAIAFQNSQAYEATNQKLHKKIRELSSSNSISKALSKTLHLSDVYNVLRENIRRNWDVANVGLWLLDENSNILLPFPKPSFHKTYAIGEEIIGEVASSGEPLLASDIKLFSEPSNTPQPTLQLIARSAACVPIMENDKVLGVLGVFSIKENEFSEDDVNLLEIFSQSATTAIRNAQFFEQIERQRATIFAAINMLNHPMVVLDQNKKLVICNKAAESLLNKISSIIQKNGTTDDPSMYLISLIEGFSEGKRGTKEIIIGENVYVATLEHASLVGTVVLMQDVTDPVTGTFNVQHFNSVAEQVFQSAKRYSKPLVAFVVGLKDLDAIINKQGYAARALILKELAFHLREFLRTTDILGRFRDDEFVIILPETTLEIAQYVAERILNSLAEKKASVENRKIPLNLRIGVAMLDIEDDPSIGKLVYKAYKAYTLAKNSGRKKIMLYDNASK
jgi:diguanylate cyclase (GGDEF)-like protein